MPYQVNIKETQKLRGNVTIGERGPAGPAGPEGPAGPQGIQGPRGANGDGTVEQAILQTSESSVSLLPNLFYDLRIENSSCVIYQGAGDVGLANEYLGQITTTLTTSTIQFINCTILTSLEVINNNEITIESGKTYLFSIINNIAIVAGV